MRTAMMAITTSSSISVKPFRRMKFPLTPGRERTAADDNEKRVLMTMLLLPVQGSMSNEIPVKSGRQLPRGWDRKKGRRRVSAR